MRLNILQPLLASQPLLWILAQQIQNDVFAGGSQIAARWKLHHPVDDQLKHDVPILIEERRYPNQALIENRPQLIPVACIAEFVVLEDLRWEIVIAAPERILLLIVHA